MWKEAIVASCKLLHDQSVEGMMARLQIQESLLSGPGSN
jgi:hypothetical protein